MKEIVTDAIVLLNRSYYGDNKVISLFTEELGRVEVTAISGFKMTSKLSPHLNPLNVVRVRLINKNKFIVADALTIESFKNIRENPKKLQGFINLSFLIQFLTPELVPDLELWRKLINLFKEEDFKNKDILNILGYEPSLSTCFKCNGRKTDYFLYEDQIFICSKCQSSINNDKLIEIIN